ncbi:hypothetical protein [Rhizobium rhizogenes]|uniref:hypothetical protein n=1 Tax=Rhizobium rhizogenes TaxID=359 RepID=UPI0022BB6CFC|nr:hypothetical protein [Rhizobium rhizogenes]MCZ7465990.1 hypothetical protein [Rhizobium rhizogenes]MCZ7482101.1 hypothetical protein [Rhizobium rhizogenes]
MYWYISILPPAAQSTLCDTALLIGFLEGQPQLRRRNAVSFGSADGQPWIDITIAKGTAEGNWSSNGTFISQFNRVEIVCSDDERQEFYVEISTKIADFLQWRLVTQDDA